MSINIINLNKGFSNNVILDNLTYEFKDNNKYIIIGDNGIGKSTLFKCILKQTKYSGFIRVNGRIGYCPDGAYYPSYMSMYKFVKIFSELNDQIDNFKELFDYYSKELNIESKKYSYLGSMSKGEKAKSNIIKTFITPSEILLFDEPLNGLDKESKIIFNNLCKKDNRLIIIITHDLEPFDDNYILLKINQGKIYEV